MAKWEEKELEFTLVNELQDQLEELKKHLEARKEDLEEKQESENG